METSPQNQAMQRSGNERVENGQSTPRPLIANVIRLQAMRRRFTIRSLLVVTFLVALFLALPLRRARMQMQGREWVATQRGHITFQYELDRSTGRYSIPFVPGFLVDWFGVDMFNPVRGVALDCETIEDLEPISKLTTLESLGIIIDMADAIDFSPLKALPRLKEIHFTKWSGLTREELTELRKFCTFRQSRPLLARQQN